MKRLTEADEEDIIFLFVEDFELEALANCFGTSVAVICDVLARHGYYIDADSFYHQDPPCPPQDGDMDPF